MLLLSKLSKLKSKKSTVVRVGSLGGRTQPIQYEYTFTIDEELFIIHKYGTEIEYVVTHFETGLRVPLYNEVFEGVEIGCFSVDDTYQSIVNVCEHKGDVLMNAIKFAKDVTIPNIEYKLNGGTPIVELINIIL